MKKAISAAIIREREILLVKKNDIWILPWWKPRNDESDTECLLREIWEELNWAGLDCISYYDSFQWITPHSKSHIEVKVYFANLTTDILLSSAEISDARYVHPSDFPKYSISDITIQILEILWQNWKL